MTGSNLRTWRISHDLTLKDVAALLEEDVNHTSISRWETDDGGQRQIPKWASDKLLAQTKITLPLDDLHALLDLARELQIPAQQLISRAISAYLAKQRSLITPAPATDSPAAAHYYTPGSESLKVAEHPTPYTTAPRKTKAPFTPKTTARLVKPQACKPAIPAIIADSASPTHAVGSPQATANIVALPPQHVEENPTTTPAATGPATDSGHARQA